MYRVAEMSGSCVRLSIYEAAFGHALSGLSPEIHSAACDALSDVDGKCCVAYDRKMLRAHCFQRSGASFYFHVWERVSTPEIAERLFSKLSDKPLPISDDISRCIYREAVAGI
jgi:hypothetical protein